MRPQSFSDTKVVYLLAELKIDIPSFLAEPLEHRQRDHCQRIFLDSILEYSVVSLIVFRKKDFQHHDCMFLDSKKY